MNALVALCHFCELHGPRTLFCTEALHPPSPSPSSQVGIPTPGDRERDGDREGEGLTMRANSSASQRGEMCEVIWAGWAETVTFDHALDRCDRSWTARLLGMQISACVSSGLCERRWRNRHTLPEPPTSQTASAFQCGPPGLCPQSQLWGKQQCLCASHTSHAWNNPTHLLITLSHHMLLEIYFNSLSLFSGVSWPWRANFLWRWATRICILTHLFYQRQPGQGVSALVQYSHGSHGQDLSNQLLAFSVTPP